MKSGLKPGLVGELTWSVTPEQTISLGGRSDASVFSTPSMINLMEHAAREALRPFLSDSEETVGIDVSIEHTGAALPGSNVIGRATLVAIEGRKLSFDVATVCEGREIGRGTHRRAIIDLERFVSKLSGDHRVETFSDRAESLPSFSTIQFQVKAKVGLLTLSRPSVLNAISSVMTDELEILFRFLENDPEGVRILIVTGAGNGFCAGDDVKELEGMSNSIARSLSLRQAEMFLKLERLPQIVIARVNGAATGAGCVFAYSCDFRIAASTSQFGMPEINLGWAPGYGLAQLAGLIGKSRAMDLCLTGRIINARQALEWGLVNEVVAPALLERRAGEFVERLLAQPAQGLRETKRQLHLTDGAAAKLAYRGDTEAYLRCFDGPDAKEGIVAFREKRAPRFSQL